MISFSTYCSLTRWLIVQLPQLVMKLLVSSGLQKMQATPQFCIVMSPIDSYVIREHVGSRPEIATGFGGRDPTQLCSQSSNIHRHKPNQNNNQPTMLPRPIPKKLGRNAVVSATLNYIRPTSHWKDIFPNNYHQTRLKFIVKDLLMDASGKRVLKLFHQDYPDKIFSAFVASVKLEKSGPPNQLFLNDGRETSPAASASLNVNDAPNDDEDPEPVDDDADNMAEGEEGTPDDNPPTDQSDGATMDGDWSWTSFFDAIANNARGSHVKSDPSLKKLSCEDLKKMEPVDFFNYFMPWKFFKDSVIPATSKALKEVGSDKTSMHEMKTWLGIWFLMSLYGQYSLHDFFIVEEKTKKRKRTDFWNPSKCGKYMSRGRFKKILTCF